MAGPPPPGGPVGRDVVEQRNQEATCFVGNLDNRVDDDLLWELFVQAGPVVSVHMPRDSLKEYHRGFAFVEMRSEVDAEYAIRVLNMVELFGRSIRVNKAAEDKTSRDIGANLFIGGLSGEVTDKVLYDTFSAFGNIVDQPHVAKNLDTGGGRGFGFVSFDSFEAADAAIEAMNGAYLGGNPIVVQYSFKKDTRERHGTQAERRLAAEARARQKLKPHQYFASAPGVVHAVTPHAPRPMVGQGHDPSRPPPPPPVGGAGGVGAGMPPRPPAYGRPPPPPMYGAYGGAPPGHMMMGGGHVPPPPPPGAYQYGPPRGFPGMPPPPPPGAGGPYVPSFPPQQHQQQEQQEQQQQQQ